MYSSIWALVSASSCPTSLWSEDSEISWTRMPETHEQDLPLDHLIQILPFLKHTPVLQSLGFTVKEQLNNWRTIVFLARAQKSGCNAFFPVVFPFHTKLLLLFTCLKRRCFLVLPACTVGTQNVSGSTTLLLPFVLWTLAASSSSDTPAYPVPHLLTLVTVSNWDGQVPVKLKKKN